MTKPPPLAISAPPGPSGHLLFVGNCSMSTALSSEGLDPRRRRLLFRGWHRGTREMDLVMGRFLDAGMAAFSDAELGEIERWIDVADPELYAWVTGEQPVPADYDTALFRRWRAFHQG